MQPRRRPKLAATPTREPARRNGADQPVANARRPGPTANQPGTTAVSARLAEVAKPAEVLDSSSKISRNRLAVSPN
ncbi:MAG: hypothetical protein KGM43_16015, partial [Planctomycetota bacterium]|nr:hypothetical protein [Planctomycetota bacterium]